MIKIIAVSVISVVLIQILKQYKSDYVILLKLAVIAVLTFLLLNTFSLSEIKFSFLSELDSQTPSYFPIILKTLGIVIITQLASSVCKDSGEETLSLITELVGKISILITSIPLIETLYSILKGYLEI